MTTKSPDRKAWEKRLLYPTAGHFDDLFSAAVPCVGESHPQGWAKPWVTESIDQDTGEHRLGHVQIGPYCHVANSKPLWVNVRKHLVDTIKRELPSVSQDVIFFDIIHYHGDAVLFARYNITKIRRVVAKLSWESIPFQHTVVVGQGSQSV